MPYITVEARLAINAGARHPETPGELNYALTCLAVGCLGPTPRYDDYNDLIEDLSILGDHAATFLRVQHPDALVYSPSFYLQAAAAIVIRYMRMRGERGVRGAIECCKLELYRRMVVPYENRKRLENGDVYPEAP